MHSKDKLILKIEYKYLKSLKINKVDTVLVGLSGGSDSMCLMDIFYKLRDIYEFELIAVHIHHGIRGREADKDLMFVKKYCKDMHIKLIDSHVDAVEYAKKNNMSLEEAARKLRYKEYDKAWKDISLKKKNGNVYLLVAHHMKDQAETILHNMIRGTGIKGLMGMKDENGYIKRPLLDVPKTDIDAYIKRYDIPYVTDSTNDDTDYTRNYIRKNVLSPMEKLNDRVYEHISEVGKTAYEINEYMEMLSKYVLKRIIISKDINHITIDLNHFRNASHIIKVYMIREVLNSLVATLKDFTKVHIEDVIALSEKEKGGHLDLPYNITIDKIKKNIIFSHNNVNISMKRKGKK